MSTITREAGAVRPARDDEGDRLARMLARSFATCPAWRWWLPPDASDRIARMERFYAHLLRERYLGDGRECTTTHGLEGAALWDPPGRWKFAAAEELRFATLALRVFRRTAVRSIRGFAALDAGHPSEPHWYLSVLGADPDTGHGRRAADALLRAGLARCDREGVPAYLETGRPASREFFASRGFAVIEQFELPGGGPPVWRMWRAPAGAAAVAAAGPAHGTALTG